MQSKQLTVFDVATEKSYPPLQAEVADSFLTRFCGLMGRCRLAAGHGLLLMPCNSVHMCFMRFAIDVVYLDKEKHILKVVERLAPWTGLSACWQAHAVLEMPADTARQWGCQVGRQLIEAGKDLHGDIVRGRQG